MEFALLGIIRGAVALRGRLEATGSDGDTVKAPSLPFPPLLSTARGISRQSDSLPLTSPLPGSLCPAVPQLWRPALFFWPRERCCLEDDVPRREGADGKGKPRVPVCLHEGRRCRCRWDGRRGDAKVQHRGTADGRPCSCGNVCRMLFPLADRGPPRYPPCPTIPTTPLYG